MRFFAVLALAGAASAALVARQTEPQCASTCIAAADHGGCSTTDNKCLCTSGLFIGSVSACIATSCSAVDQPNAFAFAQQTCEAVGVTLTMSVPSATGSTPAASTSSSAAKSNNIPVVAGVAALFAAIAL